VTVRYRFILLALGMLALLSALWGGLVRLGWELPSAPIHPAAFHGPLMVSGFLGTLIGLERSVAVGQRWSYAGPLLCGLGALTLIIGLPGTPGPFLMTLGSLVIIAVFIMIIRRHPALFMIVMGLGAVSWFVGNLLWSEGWPVYRIVPWWVAFLVLTIVGERLELARLAYLSGVRRSAFLIATGLFLCGLVLTAVSFDLGMRLTGIGTIALALWLFRNDIARRTVRQTGLTRFIAICLLSGHAWLGVGGLLALVFGGVAAGPGYDAVLHAIFLGFVFSMIFGHAPIIFPAVIGVSVPFRARFYVHLAMLHVSLFLRLAGDLAGWMPGRQWGGLLNVLAVLLFLANTGYAILGPAAPSGTVR
jgi:hypothetical protein